MNIALRKRWTQNEFFAWAQTQEMRYEFDGLRPVAMTGGNAGHSVIGQNLRTGLQNRLQGSACLPLGPDAGVETVNKTVRYPDALVTCAKFKRTDLTIPGVVIVFEVLSPSSGRTDRIEKVLEYAAVSSIRRYVILESASIALTVMERENSGDPWTKLTVLTQEAILRMPEIGIEIPVMEIYANVAFSDAEGETP
jgi:Uma2 family endonuclease